MLHGERQRKKEAGGKRPTFSIVSNNLALVWMGSLVLQNKNPIIKWTHPLEGSEQTWVDSWDSLFESQWTLHSIIILEIEFSPSC